MQSSLFKLAHKCSRCQGLFRSSSPDVSLFIPSSLNQLGLSYILETLSLVKLFFIPNMAGGHIFDHVMSFIF
jgi:hypothetical protein